MFDHVKFGVSDYAASKAFFLQALAPLGVTLAGLRRGASWGKRCLFMPLSKRR